MSHVLQYDQGQYGHMADKKNDDQTGYYDPNQYGAPMDSAGQYYGNQGWVPTLLIDWWIGWLNNWRVIGWMIDWKIDLINVGWLIY